jgi:hypothetical protein
MQPIPISWSTAVTNRYPRLLSIVLMAFPDGPFRIDAYAESECLFGHESHQLTLLQLPYADDSRLWRHRIEDGLCDGPGQFGGYRRPNVCRGIHRLINGIARGTQSRSIA